MKKQIKFNITKLNKTTEETKPETLGNKYKQINTNSSTSEKIDLLDSLAKDSRKDSFINILVKEAMKVNQMNSFKKKVSEINLKENDIDGLYEWSSLLNSGRPLSHYTRTNYKKTEENEDENKNHDNIISPKILVDLPDDKMQYFFGKNSFGNIKKTSKFRNKSKNENKKEKYTPNFRKNNTYTEKQNNINIINTTPNINENKNNKNKIGIRKRNVKLPTWHFPYKNRESLKTQKEETKTDINNNNNNNHVQPISIYSKYGPNNTFYFSNAFSDYYKEDFKSFTKKMPVLRAKIKTNSSRLKTEIKRQQAKAYIKEQILYDIIKKDDLILRKQDLIISAERRNPVPLMKYIYKQEYPNAQEIKEHIRKYFKTMKPYGNDDGKVDYTQNDRWKLNKELIKFRKMENKLNSEKKNKNKKLVFKKEGKLILNYYDINDPDLKIFNKLNLESLVTTDENKKNYSFEYKNHFGNTYDYTIEEKNRAKTIDNEKLRPKSSYSIKKEINTLSSDNGKIKNRPHSSNIRRNNFLEDKYFFDIKDFNELYKDYLPSNRFPLKTSSKINNISYNKINELMKERYFKKKMSDNYFITEPDIKIMNNIKNKKYNSYNNSKNLYLNAYYGNRNKSKENKGIKARPKTVIGLRKEKCNVIDFNKYIDTNFDLKMNKVNNEIYFTPMNCFNKLAGKYYSSSNNVHIKIKRKKREKILDMKNTEKNK